MIRIDILTVVPEILAGPLTSSIPGRAQSKGHVSVHVHNIREYGKGRYRQVDDYAFGGEAGMVLMIEPIYELIEKLKSERTYDEIIYLTPDGERLAQGTVNRLSTLQNVLLLCGHYKGIDHRIREQLITKEISIGDYVLSGGELAAAVLVDAIARIVPGVISDETSALTDSFQDGLLAPPVYTRPETFRGWRVPDVLLSGNHRKIAEWQEEQALQRTRQLRPDLLAEHETNPQT